MRICLNMIVRNEIETVERCIASVRGLINCWAILDTGSTDGTQAKIRELLAGVPGELYERPAPSDAPIALGPARNEALELARAMLAPGDFILLTAARQYVVSSEGFSLARELEKGADCYEVEIHDCGTRYLDTLLVKAGLPWRFMGLAHEYLWCPQPTRSAKLEAIYRVRPPKDPESTLAGLKRDREILEAQVKREPENARARFYLAQTCRDLGMLEKAFESYSQRAVMGGFEEEAWRAQYEAAMLRERLRGSAADVLFAYTMAFQRRPTRAEPLYQMARFCREKSWWQIGLLFADRARRIARPQDERLFVEEEVYAWRALDEFAIAAYWTGNHDAALKANQELLSEAPASEHQRIRQNMEFSKAGPLWT
jgi:tetratricopeptide (TPR) repeat protein